MVIERARRSRLAADVVAACLLLALPWLLYGRALDLWWSYDDFFQLRYTLEHAPSEYVLEPEVWQLLPNRVLSPLLFVSYELDLALFGLAPAAFYAHQLAAIGLAVLALYLVLRLWLPPPWAGLGALVFLLGPPVASFAPLLMVRHYPEAIALGLLSAWAFVLAARRRGGPAVALAVLSALAYLAASLAKEIAVPLPAVLALLPAARARRRLLLLAPHAAAGAGYVAYRTWMLETPLGGYGWTPGPAGWWGVAAALPGKLALELAGPSAWGWAALAALLAVVLALAFRSRRAAALLGAGLLVAALPVLPVSIEMEPRYAAATWLALAAAFAPAARSLCRRSPGRRAGAVLVVVALLSAIAGNRAARGERLAEAERVSAENRGFLGLGPREVIRKPASPSASMAQLRGFARTLLHRPARGGWFHDDLFLCRRGAGSGPRAAIRALWAYEAEAGRLVEITSELPVLRRSYCSGLRRHVALAADLRSGPDGVLAWSLGPYEDGAWAFVLDDGLERFDVPRRGGFRLGETDRLTLRVRYESPEGWVTYSQPLTIELGAGTPVRWRRGVPAVAPTASGEPG